MDHRYIDEHLVADRYLDRVLAPEERGEFEAHLVDCLECRDRLLLAEMFHARNGVGKLRRPLDPGDAPAPPRIRLATRFAVSQIVLIFAAAAAAAILLLLALAGVFWCAVH
jgi:anti-sigma factor RsiW